MILLEISQSAPSNHTMNSKNQTKKYPTYAFQVPRIPNYHSFRSMTSIFQQHIAHFTIFFIGFHIKISKCHTSFKS